MEEQKLLQHLLDIEAKAASLVEEAQALADKRVAEGDAALRKDYDARYAGEAALLEKARLSSLARTRAEYEEQLSLFQKELDAAVPDRGGFNSLLESCLFAKQ
jgi:hypothetical protein